MSPSSGPMLNWESSSAGVRLLRPEVGNRGWRKRLFEKFNIGSYCASVTAARVVILMNAIRGSLGRKAWPGES
jgi:hypothetical protein